LSDNWYKERLNNDIYEENRILRAADKILHRHIREQVYCNDTCPAAIKYLKICIRVHPSQAHYI
jgi:hypothetical protein